MSNARGDLRSIPAPLQNRGTFGGFFQSEENYKLFPRSPERRPQNGGYRLLLQAQTARDENAIEKIEQQLHQQRENGGGNGAFQNRDVIV